MKILENGARSHYSEPLLYGLLIFLMTISVIGSDIYVPSLPHIVSYFSTTNVFAKYTFAVYFIGFSLSQLFYGPLSDAFGRRPLLLAGLVIALLGSILCTFSFSIQCLIVGRLIQGIGIGSGICLARSIAQDVFSGSKFFQVLSYLSLVSGLAPALAPLIGSYFQHYFGWQSVFIFISVYMFITLMLVYFFLPETNLQLNKQAIQLKQVFINYKSLITCPIFLGNVICGSCAISGILVYYTLSPFLLQKTLHLNVITYGWFTVFISIAILAGRIINVYCIKYCSAKFTTGSGNFLMVLSSLAMLLLSFFYLNIAVIIVPVMFFVIGTGLVFSSSAVAAFAPFKKIAGSAGALYTSLQTLGAFLSSFLAAHLHTNNQKPLAIVMVLLGLIALGGYLLANKKSVVEEKLVLKNATGANTKM